jgi:hypothetical protein
LRCGGTEIGEFEVLTEVVMKSFIFWGIVSIDVWDNNVMSIFYAQWASTK